jgi:hypothetical protein
MSAEPVVTTPSPVAADRDHPADEYVGVRGCDLFDLAPDGRIRRKDSYRKLVT